MSADAITEGLAKLSPEMIAAALEAFVTINPHMRGAHWDDCLEMILDADGQLAILGEGLTAQEDVIALTAYFAGAEAAIRLSGAS